MPLRWRTNFINSGQSLHESSLEVIKTYMIHQEHQTDAHRRKTRDANSKNNPHPHPLVGTLIITLKANPTKVEINNKKRGTLTVRGKGCQMTTIAHFMAPPISGANATRTSTAKIFAQEEMDLHPITLHLPQHPVIPRQGLMPL